ncbi:MAG: hypothetical protein GF334_02720 [Candidatus Altiarchaeales archaeon]|nr:hypothetical protein [Candidatus Altiarchaeales archaeon]
MNLLVIGDFPETSKSAKTADYLDLIHREFPITKIITFDFSGVYSEARVWAYDKDIPSVMYEASKAKTPPNKPGHCPNQFLRKVVDDYHVDGFLFVFIDNDRDKSHHRSKIRSFFRRSMKAFKRQKVFSNKKYAGM